MKDVFQVWHRVAGRTYSAVNTNNVQDQVFNNVNFDNHKSNSSKRTRRFVALTVMAFFSLGVGLFITFVKPYDIIFKWKNIFADGGEIFELWRKPEVNLYLKVYLFNVTNAEEFMSGADSKLKFEEVGPYVYREGMEHGDVVFNENGTLTTTPLHPLEWQPELSYPRREDDKVIMANIAYLAIGHVTNGKSIFIRMPLNALLKSTGAKPLVEMTAKEFMFGYTSSLVTLGNNFLPGWIKFDKLGLIDRMYDFNGDFETIFTGEDDETKAGLIDTWRGSKTLPHWGDTKCADVHMASDASKFPGNLKEDDDILFYRKSLCRAAPMTKIGDDYRDGLHVYKYGFKENILDNGHKNPENKCFCRQGKCLQEGLIDVTDCYYGFPIALSYPHFLDSDPAILNKLEGVNPEESYRSSILLQPKAGLPMAINIKFQINMALDSLDNIRGGKPFSNMVLPLLWFEFDMNGLPDSMANRFNLYLKILPEAEKVLMWLGYFAVAPFLAAALLIKLRRPSHHIPKRSPYIWDDNSAYAKSLRKMSLDIEKSKLQSVYTPCELPLPENGDSDSPFLKNSSDDKTSSSESETEPEINPERRQSLLKDLRTNLGNKIQENFEGISKNLKNFAERLGNETLRSSFSHGSAQLQSDSCQSSEEDNFQAEVRRYSMPGEILGHANDYHTITSSSEDDEVCCEVEIVDDGSEFVMSHDEIKRRQSVELTDKLKRLMDNDEKH